LTRRPCKGDGFGVLIFEAKRQNACICRTRQKVFATWTFVSTGKRVTQEWKFAFRLRSDSILLFKGQKKHIRNLWFSIIRIISGWHSLIQFFPLLDAWVPERLWQRRSHRLQQGDIVTPCPAVGPNVSFQRGWTHHPDKHTITHQLWLGLNTNAAWLLMTFCLFWMVKIQNV
jgi:hypothetical protein